MLVIPRQGLFAAALLLLAVSHQAARAEDACPALFANGQAPTLSNPKLAARTTALCFEAFAVVHDASTRTPKVVLEAINRVVAEPPGPARLR